MSRNIILRPSADFLALWAVIDGPNGTLRVDLEPYGDSVSGEYHGGWEASIADAYVGKLDYAYAPGYGVGIRMVEVVPEFRGQGIATALLERLRAEFPDKEIDPGMLTPDGAAWWSRVGSKTAATSLDGVVTNWATISPWHRGPIKLLGFHTEAEVYSGLSPEAEEYLGRTSLLGEGFYIAPSEDDVSFFGGTPEPYVVSMENPKLIVVDEPITKIEDLWVFTDAHERRGHDGIILFAPDVFGDSETQAVVFSRDKIEVYSSKASDRGTEGAAQRRAALSLSADY